jgi:hypothetical protein
MHHHRPKMNLEAIKYFGKFFCDALMVPLELLIEPIASNLLEYFTSLRVCLKV